MKKKLSANMSMITAVTLGISCSIVVSVLLLLLGTAMINMGNAQISISNYIMLPIQGLSVLAGCALSGILAGERSVFACLLTAGCYLTILILTALLFMDGLHGKVLLSIAAIACGCLAEILILTMKKGRRKKRTKSRFR
ncbi:MAG: hypothetical protein J6Q92_04140 [Oscillospiraceae bacterium]|nr:hypothetical protein [Oscillospiraceae bacterium]